MASPPKPSVLSSDDRQRLEAMLRNPQIFAGTRQTIVDETLKRATQVLEQSKANEQALKTAAELREKALRQVLDGATPDKEAQRKEVQALIQGLITQIEAALGPAAKP
ncbi:hypothetical protein BFW88_00515 [Pseudomonas fluorescens]|jgi:geranylgeranyl pyrophosphate synthase|nr:hypothetical protein BFW86_00425 [Pseudomonas fluorescens]RMT90988.1 hypothetical protein ALP39_200430 [Pseudomonas marginalis pv. marginalis]OPA98804.1 hypothetical protein BFW88_00515 [Pseudomonas fluorescens]OPB14931.1 hypothetical protein BFW92_00515 [Pseudomonas fluorescens]OPB28432.1 hypothetical protein BFW93_00515 [Pseudomonas fluorescens]